MELRYMGFDQKQNIRAYRFEGLSKGESNAHFVVNVDLALFLEHHINIQEGPRLCADKLTITSDSPRQGDHELTRGDLLAHANARALADARKAELRRRGPRRHQAS